MDDTLLTCSLEFVVESVTSNADSTADKVLSFYRWMQAVDPAIPSVNEDHAAYYFARQSKQPIALLELFQKMCECV